MHIAELEVRLTGPDLRGLLSRWRPARALGGIEVTEVALAGDRIRARVQLDGLPALPLQVRIAGVEPQALTLDVDLEGDGLTEGLLDVALGLVGEWVFPAGVTFTNGQVRLDLERLLDRLPVRAILQDARVEGEYLHLAFREVEWPGVTPEEPLPPEDAPEQDAEAAPGVAPGEAAAEEEPQDPAVTGEAPAEEAAEVLEEGIAAVTGDRGASGLTGAELPPERTVPPEHRGTYQGLRDRVARYLDRSLPRWLQPAVPWLLLLPDLTVLIARLATDPRVSRRAKLLAGAVLAYIALPLDLLPDVLPLVGILDDLALVILALEGLVALSPPGVVRELWPGEGDILAVVRSGLEWASRYFPRGLMRRLRDWLHREGAPT